MQSEGPYKVVNKEAECYSFSVIGPGVDWPDRAYEGTAKRICEIANTAHAEGRKAMEKEVKEALGWADSICLDWNYSKDYKKWKKARGIE